MQHLLLEDAALLQALLLRRGAFLFVCGDGLTMARDVHKALVALLAFKATSAPEEEASGEATLTEAGAEAWLQAMKDDGKYVQDIWS